MKRRLVRSELPVAVAEYDKGWQTQTLKSSANLTSKIRYWSDNAFPDNGVHDDWIFGLDRMTERSLKTYTKIKKGELLEIKSCYTYSKDCRIILLRLEPRPGLKWNYFVILVIHRILKCVVKYAGGARNVCTYRWFLILVSFTEFGLVSTLSIFYSFIFY